MKSKESQVEIEVLHRQGKSIRAIERETGIARNTIRSILRGIHDSRYGPRAPRLRKLEPYKRYLEERLEAAGKIYLPATVLLREIRAQGYGGAITQLKEYLRTIRPVPEPEPIIRFETPPGLQLQIDFVVFRRGSQPLRAFTAELGYSRYAYAEFTNNERSETLIACLERALSYFGGVPRHILCDNPKTIILKRDAYGDGQHRYHAAYRVRRVQRLIQSTRLSVIQARSLSARRASRSSRMASRPSWESCTRISETAILLHWIQWSRCDPWLKHSCSICWKGKSSTRATLPSFPAAFAAYVRR